MDRLKKPFLTVVLVQAIYAGMFLLSKAAFNGGMNNFVFIVYRQAAATVFLIPLSMCIAWKTAPPLSIVTFCKIFMLSLFGITLSLNLYGIALIYTSATLAAATTNCLPVITFLLAVLLGIKMFHAVMVFESCAWLCLYGKKTIGGVVCNRMEALKLRTIPGVAKLVGILICTGGAATLAFYHGPQFKVPCHIHIFYLRNSREVEGRSPNSGKTWIKGCFLMLTSNTCWGLWLVLQGRVLKSYPSKLLFTTLQCFMSTVQSLVVAIVLVREPHEWVLGWNLRLLAVAYSGVVVTGVSFYLQAWVIEKKGPVFLAMSTPLTLIFTMISSVFLLCEIITLGRILGGLLLIGGLYSVLWGKSREQKILEATQAEKLATVTPSSPLLV